MIMNTFLCYVVFNDDFFYAWHHFSWCCDSICVNYEPPTEANPIWTSFPWPRWLLKALYHPSTFISGTEDHPECQLSVTSCKGSGSVSCSRTVWRANFRVGKCTTDPHMGSCHWPPSLAPALQRGSSHFVSINIIWSDERIKFVKQPGLGVVPNSGFHSIQSQQEPNCTAEYRRSFGCKQLKTWQ